MTADVCLFCNGKDKKYKPEAYMRLVNGGRITELINLRKKAAKKTQGKDVDGLFTMKGFPALKKSRNRYHF